MPGEFTFSPIATPRAVELVASRLEERILDGTFRVGDMLPSEEQLAAQFGLGRRSVREALKVLEAKGLLEIRMGVGATVKRNDLDSFLDILTRNMHSYFTLKRADLIHVRDLRLLLEGAALEHVARTRPPELLASLAQCVDQQQQALEAADPSAYQQRHFRFHFDIVDAMGNPLASMIYKQVLQLLQSAMERAGALPGVMARAIGEHRRIVAALSQGEVARVRPLLEEHLAGFVAHLNAEDGDGKGA